MTTSLLDEFVLTFTNKIAIDGPIDILECFLNSNQFKSLVVKKFLDPEALKSLYLSGLLRLALVNTRELILRDWNLDLDFKILQKPSEYDLESTIEENKTDSNHESEEVLSTFFADALLLLPHLNGHQFIQDGGEISFQRPEMQLHSQSSCSAKYWIAFFPILEFASCAHKLLPSNYSIK